MLKQLLQELAKATDKKEEKPLSSFFGTDATEPDLLKRDDGEEVNPKVTIMKAKGFLKSPKLHDILGLGMGDEEDDTQMGIDDIGLKDKEEIMMEGAEQKKLDKILSLLSSK